MTKSHVRTLFPLRTVVATRVMRRELPEISRPPNSI